MMAVSNIIEYNKFNNRSQIIFFAEQNNTVFQTGYRRCEYFVRSLYKISNIVKQYNSIMVIQYKGQQKM